MRNNVLESLSVLNDYSYDKTYNNAKKNYLEVTKNIKSNKNKIQLMKEEIKLTRRLIKKLNNRKKNLKHVMDRSIESINISNNIYTSYNESINDIDKSYNNNLLYEYGSSDESRDETFEENSEESQEDDNEKDQEESQEDDNEEDQEESDDKNT